MACELQIGPISSVDGLEPPRRSPVNITARTLVEAALLVMDALKEIAPPIERQGFEWHGFLDRSYVVKVTGILWWRKFSVTEVMVYLPREL